MKKLIVSLLCILLLGSVVVGCTTGSGNPASTTDPKGSTVETSGSDTSVKDGVPEGMNFNGTNIVTSYREDRVDYFVGDVDGDVMSEALYKANLAVEERLGITREFIPLLDEVLTSKIVESILSDEPYYDYVSIDQFYGTSYCSEGLYMDLSSLPYIDYSEPWYYSAYMETLSIGKGTRFFIAGDVYPIISSWTQATFWNKTVYGDSVSTDMTSLYKLVEDGGWTFDEMQKMCTMVYSDLDADHVVSAGDRVGACNSVYGADHLAFSMGMQLTSRNEDGYYDLVADTERNNDIVTKINDFFTKNTGYFMWTFDLDPNFTAIKFAADELLFYQSAFLNILGKEIRDMKSEFGVIPYPKYDENQKDYIATVHNSAFFVAIPSNTPDERLDAIAATIEAQGYQNWKDYRPVFFEEALKVKFNRDDENAEKVGEMIDLIRKSLSVDFAYIYSNNCNDLGRIAANCINTGRTLAQSIASDREKIQAGLDNLFEAFENNYRGK